MTFFLKRVSLQVPGLGRDFHHRVSVLLQSKTFSEPFFIVVEMFLKNIIFCSFSIMCLPAEDLQTKHECQGETGCEGGGGQRENERNEEG